MIKPEFTIARMVQETQAISPLVTHLLTRNRLRNCRVISAVESGAEDDNVKVFRQERKLVIYLAYVAKEMSKMATIFELLTANLE